MAGAHQAEQALVSTDKRLVSESPANVQGTTNHEPAWREWRRLQARIAFFPELIDRRLELVETRLNDYRLAISNLQFKAPDLDRRVWEAYNHIKAERIRLGIKKRQRPLFLRGLTDLRRLSDAWEKLRQDQTALLDMLAKAPAELAEYNEKQVERERKRQEESRQVELNRRFAAARRALDIAIAYVEQLHHEGRVTFGSQVLQLEEAKLSWREQLEQALQELSRGEISSEDLVASIYNLETQIREAPSMSMRIREVEERFSRLVARHDMLASYGNSIIAAKDLARMTVKLHEQIPQLWMAGERLEIDHNLEVIEDFVTAYESMVENEAAYLERRRPGLMRAPERVIEEEGLILMQVGIMARSLITAIDSRDKYMRGHSETVSRLVGQMARATNWSKTDTDYLMIAALLHDVGKISIPENILTKTDPLNEDEWRTIQMHPYYGAQIIKPVESLARVVPWVYHHQERWDGKGYPDHLAGKQIPPQASYISVAEAFSVMTTETPARPALSDEEALDELRKGSETQFNPEAVAALVQAIGQRRE